MESGAAASEGKPNDELAMAELITQIDIAMMQIACMRKVVEIERIIGRAQCDR